MNDIDADYEKARDTYYELLEMGKEGLENMLNLARESEHPRAFEVFSTLLKQNADIADKLMALQKAKKDISKTTGDTEAPKLTQNNIFVGSTSDLQKMLSDKMASKIIENE